MLTTWFHRAFYLAVSCSLAGCGLIADKDQIVVARIDDREITRADVKAALRAMPDDERPIITNRGDLERFLRDHIDRQIRDSLRLDLAAEGKIDVPMEAAAQRYFAEHPDQAMIPQMTDPAPLGISEAELQSLKKDVEYEIGLVHDAMMRERAVQYFATQAIQEGLITISDEELQREYEFQKDNLLSFEYIDFIALRFPAAMQGSISVASNIRRQIDAGASFDAIVDEVAARNPELVFASRFENNPNSPSFQTFWSTASGVEDGDILGPVFIPAYSLINSEGETVQMPDAYLVLKVEKHEPAKPLSFEAAKPSLMGFIAIRKAAELLREQHGVEFYYEDLWDPGMVGEQDVML